MEFENSYETNKVLRRKNWRIAIVNILNKLADIDIGYLSCLFRAFLISVTIDCNVAFMVYA